MESKPSDNSVKKGQGDEDRNPDLEAQRIVVRDTMEINQRFESIEREKSFLI